jgi:large subunit ribosomal protein L13
MKKIIDATNCVAGRLASFVAKELLKGNEICVVNAEKAVITGNKDYTLKHFKEKVSRGDPYHGPFYPKKPDRILKRIIRGMLPYKKPRGREAFKRLKVFISVPNEMDKDKIKIEEVINKEERYITLGELSEKLGAKKTW